MELTQESAALCLQAAHEIDSEKLLDLTKRINEQWGSRRSKRDLAGKQDTPPEHASLRLIEMKGA
jgi:hypothetical protein